MKELLLALAVVLASCRGQPPVSAPDREVPASTVDPGPSSGTSFPSVTVGEDGGRSAASAPGSPDGTPAGCRNDADCGRGRVCGRCGDGPGECVEGCSTSADCPAGSTCVRVQCIRCPCPAQCMKR